MSKDEHQSGPMTVPPAEDGDGHTEKPPGGDDGQTETSQPERPAGEPPAGEPVPQASALVRRLAKTLVGAYLVTAGVWATIAVVAVLTKNNRAFDLTAGRWCALAFGFGTVAVALLIIHRLGRQPSGFGVLRPIIGADHRISTSLTQLGLWTIAAGTGFGYLLGRTIFDNGAALSTTIPADRWDDYLILLGGPFAAAVLAKGIVAGKVDDGKLQKPDAGTTEARQAVTDDKGQADLVDAQYLLFNVIALGYFVIAIWSTPVLPQIPAPLLAMTSATAALYVGFKAAVSNPPVITSVSPRSALPGSIVRVRGQNFDPGHIEPAPPADARSLRRDAANPGPDPKPVKGADSGRRINVNLSGVSYPVIALNPTGTSLEFEVPATATAGWQTVTVVSTAGTETTPYNLLVLSLDPYTTGLRAGALRPGTPAVLTGRHLGTPGQNVRVTVGTTPVAATANADGTELAFTWPPDMPGAAADVVEITVQVPGRADLKAVVPVDQPRINHVSWRSSTQIDVSATGWTTTGSPGDPPPVGGVRPPVVLCNGRPGGLDGHWEHSSTHVPLRVTVPTDVLGAAQIRVVVIDNLRRPSAEYLLTEQPPAPAVLVTPGAAAGDAPGNDNGS